MSNLLDINEASQRIGVSADTLRRWCNHIDPKTGHHAPKIEHVRIGDRGRRNPKIGASGQIKIFEHVVAAFLEDRTFRLAAEPPDFRPKPRRYRSRHF